MNDPIRRGVRRFFRLAIRRPDQTRAEIDEELRLHIEARTEQFVMAGMSAEAARAAAIARLGGSLDATRDSLRASAERKEQQLMFRDHLEGLLHDIRYAARGLVQRPAFTAIAVLTLAVGIGANTAIFSAVDALLLRTLPFRDPSTLIDIVQRTPFDPANGGSGDSPWSYPKFLAFRDAQRSYSTLAMDARQTFILAGDTPERIDGELVSEQFLGTLGTSVVAGHDFPAGIDAQPGSTKSVIISNALWQRRFNADPAVIGSLLRVDTSSYEVIGVLPAGFRGMSGRADILLPVTSRTPDNLGAWDLEFSLVGRLRPGITAVQADADAKRIAPIVYQATPQDKNTLSSGPGGAWSAAARPLNSVRVASALRRSLLVLFGAVGLVLLIACVNLASLLLGRAASRRQEIAVRLAMGAGRGRLVRLLLCESMMIALAGGLASVLLATWGTAMLRALNPEGALQAQGLTGSVGVVGFEGVHLDLRALAFTFAVTLLVGLLFGLVPALHATRTELTEDLKEGGAGAGRSRNRSRGRRILVVAEVALALVLLAGSGLMLRSLGNVLAIDQGFDPSRLLTLRLSVPPGAVARDSMPGFYDAIQARLASVPGVQQVSLIDCPPLNGGCNGTLMTFPDRPASSNGNAIVGVHWTTASWFASLHVPLKRGRMFTDADRAGAPKMVLISESAAKKYWPAEDPIGKTVRVYQGGFHTGATVIGIVGDVRFGTIDSLPAPDVYISYSQAYTPRIMIFLRTAADPFAVVGSVRRALHEVAPAAPLYDVAAMSDRVGAASAQARYSAVLLAAFAAIALGLAVIGIYGVLAFAVTERTREIGIRMALGADRRRVLDMVIREGVGLVTIGVAFGLVAAVAATRVLRSLLFEVTPGDPLTYAAIVVLIAIAALVATMVPARRAASIAPTEALRRG